MHPNFGTILASHFDTPTSNADLTLVRELKALHPDSQHVAMLDCSLSVSGYFHTRDIAYTITKDDENLAHQLFNWDQTSSNLYPKLVTGGFRFVYDGVDFIVYKISWTVDFSNNVLYDFVFQSSSDEVGRKLVADIYVWSNGLKEEIWVFQDGYWKKDKALWTAVHSSSWDDLVLKDEFLEGLRTDTKTFFSNKAIYKSLGITWKRGLLLLGPPGNGKTESIKALLNESGQNALYVKSFTTQAGPEYGIRQIFDHARDHSPCILIIEDLDSMVTDEVRSFFLNELDGLGQNEGILTIATTNHAERIDDAIINRPSRFDVKYSFDLPDSELRAKYTMKWLNKIKSTMMAAENVDANDKREWLEDEHKLVRDITDKTEGWSFAFLKELFVSFLLRIAHDRAKLKEAQSTIMSNESTMDRVLLHQVEQLSTQILKVKAGEAAEGADMQKATSTNHAAARLAARRLALASSPTPVVHAGTNF